MLIYYCDAVCFRWHVKTKCVIADIYFLYEWTFLDLSGYRVGVWLCKIKMSQRRAHVPLINANHRFKETLAKTLTGREGK